MHGPHEDHPVGEDGALEQAQGRGPGGALALLHHPGDEDVVLEGVGVALRVGVELIVVAGGGGGGRERKEKKSG